MRYAGFLAYGEQTEVSPGVWEDVITEHRVLGKVEQRVETVGDKGEILPGYRTTTTVEIPARGLGFMDNSKIRYLTLGGSKWTVSSIPTKNNTLTLYIGEEYHGPAPVGATSDP